MQPEPKTLEEVEQAYFSLSTKVIYAGFDNDGADPRDESRLEELAQLLVMLSAPKLQLANSD